MRNLLEEFRQEREAREREGRISVLSGNERLDVQPEGQVLSQGYDDKERCTR